MNGSASADRWERGGGLNRVLFAIIGLVNGAALWLLARRLTAPGAVYRDWIPVAAACVIVWALVLQFAWSERPRRLFPPLVLLTLLFGPVTYWVGAQASDTLSRAGDVYRATTWGVGYWLALTC